MEEFKRAAAGECYLTFLSATEKANCARQQQLGRVRMVLYDFSAAFCWLNLNCYW